MVVLLVAAVLVNGAPPPVDGGAETAQPCRAPWQPGPCACRG